jgi:hypothetical protein
VPSAPPPETSPATPADLFVLIWSSLAETLGTAAAATLIRRATKQAVHTTPDLPSVTINRDTVTYGYEVPAIWRRPADTKTLASLQALATELGSLLVELTGVIVVRQLERIEPLREAGIVFRGAGSPP